MFLDALRRGASKSCGCLASELLAARSMTHGHSAGRKESPELKSYNHAKSRCMNPNDPKYAQYGARGITMCPEWAADPGAFLRYMGPRPPGTSIERLRVDEGYGPGNCVWATARAQSRNRTDTVWVTYLGERMVLKDCAELTQVSYKALHRRVRVVGQPVEEAVRALRQRKQE